MVKGTKGVRKGALSLAQSPFKPVSPRGGGQQEEGRVIAGGFFLSRRKGVHTRDLTPRYRQIVAEGRRTAGGSAVARGRPQRGRHSETIPNVKRGAVAYAKGRTTTDTGGGGTGTGYPGGPRSASWREPATFAVPGPEGGSRGRNNERTNAQKAHQSRTDGRTDEANPRKGPQPKDRKERKQGSNKEKKGKEQGERRNGGGRKRSGEGHPL